MRYKEVNTETWKLYVNILAKFEYIHCDTI